VTIDQVPLTEVNYGLLRWRWKTAFMLIAFIAVGRKLLAGYCQINSSPH
jgi:hypothetical protein